MPVSAFIRDYVEASEDAKRRNEEFERQLKSRQKFRAPRRRR